MADFKANKKSKAIVAKALNNQDKSPDVHSRLFKHQINYAKKQEDTQDKTEKPR